ncbi:RING finger protein 223-like [Centroberyx affinis]|uniref:RING finger protein 223-like n=1 Tax=Centroberyx affinis TaxID=166261 RepID=UPI003A5C720D
MVVNEEQECAVCFQAYSRQKRIPRVLHCSHTFCTPCLDLMSSYHSGIRTISCPLCRWITCSRVSLTLSGTLWVNTEIWDQISCDQQLGEEEDTMEEWIHNHTEMPPLSPSRHSGFKSKLQKCLKTLSCVMLQAD